MTTVPLRVTLLLCLVCTSARAETPVRNSLDAEEVRMVSEANLAYTICLQQNAWENLASSPDIRIVAANAAETCNPVLAELETTLTDRGVNPAFHASALTRIKNRAIRRLLPLLMMEKSNQAP